MNKVVDSADRFELKAGLDGATKNLDKILDSLGNTVINDSGNPQAGIAFAKLFLEGSIAHFPVLLEDSDALYDIIGDETYGRVVKTIYAYKSNPGLTLALALSFPDAPLMKVVSEDGYLLTTGLWNAQTECLLNVNGIHAKPTLIEHLTNPLNGSPVQILPTTVTELALVSTFDDADMQIALGHFGFVASYMVENLRSLTTEPARWSMDDEDYLEDEDSPSPGF